MFNPDTAQQPTPNKHSPEKFNFCSRCTAARAAGTKAADTPSAGEKPLDMEN